MRILVYLFKKGKKCLIFSAIFYRKSLRNFNIKEESLGEERNGFQRSDEVCDGEDEGGMDCNG